MKALLFLAPALSLLVLAAHFFREGAWPVTLLCVALVGLLAVKKDWAARVLQVALVAGSLEWLWTAFLLVQQRLAYGRPWLRLALILAVVALITAASALAVERLRKRYRAPAIP